MYNVPGDETVEKHFLHIYAARIPEDIASRPLWPPERQRQLEKTRNLRVRRERYAVWRLLELALDRSLGIKITDLDLRMDENGRWEAEGVFFSLSHSRGAAACALSDSPVGVDIEEAEGFLRRFGGKSASRRLAQSVCTPGELAGEPEGEALLALWTKKEAIFKRRGSGLFIPRELDTLSEPAVTKTVLLGGRYILSAASPWPEAAEFFTPEL